MSPPTSAARLEPFVVVYDLFKPEECVAAIARHVTERIPTLGGEPAYFTATRSGRTGEVVLTGSHFNGVEIRVLTRVHTLTRFVRGNACPRCESTALWSAFRTTEADWASIGADAVGCDECGWIASDHPVAGRPSVRALDDHAEISGAKS